MLRWLTAGESHGPALMGILEGLPAGIPLAPGDFAGPLAARWAGYGRGGRRALEPERVELLSGVWEGRTTGAPIGLVIRNADVRPTRGGEPVTIPRPGHADLAGMIKYGFDDVRPIRERASARETAMRVALAVPVKKFLLTLGIESLAWVRRIGGIPRTAGQARDLATLRRRLERSGADGLAFRHPDRKTCDRWRALIDAATSRGDTLGGEAEVLVSGLPIGLGSHVQADRRLDARLAAALMGIPGVRAVEIGDGILQSKLPGLAAQDALCVENGRPVRSTNLAGGLEGGMTNGEELSVRAVMKPPPGTGPLPSVDFRTRLPADAPPQRSDTVAVAAMALVAEAMVQLVLGDALLETLGGDTVDEVAARLRSNGNVSSGGGCRWPAPP